MPLQSTMTADEKAKVKSVLSANNKILMATVARIYYAHPDPNAWTFSGRQGGLAFVKDKNNGLYYFRLVDLQGTTGVLWEHELYEGFTLYEDRPFFHSFVGDDCMIGLVYSDEGEASSFMKVVTKKKGVIGKARTEATRKKSKSSKSGKINKSMISAPQAGSFKHVSHMGYDADQGFTSENVDPSWLTFLHQLEQHGVDPALIADNMEFIKDFVKDAQQPKKKAVTNAHAGEAPAKKPSQKPPVPPSPAQRSKSQKSTKPPAPPVPRRQHGQQDSVSSVQTPVESPKRTAAPPAPPPPAPPAAPPAPPPPAPPSAAPAPPAPPPPAPPIRAPPSVAPPPPPPPAPPSRPPIPSIPSPAPNASAAPPPPPPPPPPVSGVPPPPPPPPPMVGAPPPPPPPPPGGAPPPVAASLPSAPPGRSALLESIQGKGVHTLRKTEGPKESIGVPVGRVAGSPAPQTPGGAGGASGGGTEESSPAAAASGGGGDLAAALAAALTQRNKKLGESDDEDDEEEWD